MSFLACMGYLQLSRASVRAKLNLEGQRVIMSMDTSGEFTQKFKILSGMPSGKDKKTGY